MMLATKVIRYNSIGICTLVIRSSIDLVNKIIRVFSETRVNLSGRVAKVSVSG